MGHHQGMTPQMVTRTSVVWWTVPALTLEVPSQALQPGPYIPHCTVLKGPQQKPGPRSSSSLSRPRNCSQPSCQGPQDIRVQAEEELWALGATEHLTTTTNQPLWASQPHKQVLDMGAPGTLGAVELWCGDCSCRAAPACLSGFPGTRLTVLEGTGHSWGTSSPFEALAA